MVDILMTKFVCEKNKIDFLLCIGDGLSDEEMFVSIKNRIIEKPEDFVVYPIFLEKLKKI